MSFPKCLANNSIAYRLRPSNGSDKVLNITMRESSFRIECRLGLSDEVYVGFPVEEGLGKIRIK